MMLIKISQQDINLSTRGSCKNCPIANALKRIGFKNPVVANNSIYIDGDGEFTKRKIDLPKVAINFLMDFDFGNQVEEFEFDLNLTVKDRNTLTAT